MYIDPSNGALYFRILVIGLPVVFCVGSLIIGGTMFIIARRADKKTLESMDETFHED